MVAVVVAEGVGHPAARDRRRAKIDLRHDHAHDLGAEHLAEFDYFMELLESARSDAAGRE